MQEVEPELTVRLQFYQNGILRCTIAEPNSSRFRISQEGLSVVDKQLRPVPNFESKVYVHSAKNHLEIFQLESDAAEEQFGYQIDFNPFLITQTSGKVQTLQINPLNDLYLEVGTVNQETLQAVSLGFSFAQNNLYGLPERKDTLLLQNTHGAPY